MQKKTRYHRLMLGLGLILGLAGVILIGFTSFESHQVRQQLQQTQAVKSQQKHVVKQQERQLKAVSVKSPAHAQLNDAVTRLVQAMYTFKNGQSYVANRKAVLPLIDSNKLPDKQLNRVYATGLDDDGQNMIDGLKMKSSVTKVTITVADQTSHQSTQLANVLVDYSLQTASQPKPQDAIIWLQIKYNEQSHKITGLDKVGLV